MIKFIRFFFKTEKYTCEESLRYNRWDTCLNNKHWWFSGRMLACHAGGPGSIPGQCIFGTFIKVVKLKHRIASHRIIKKVIIFKDIIWNQFKQRFFFFNQYLLKLIYWKRLWLRSLNASCDNLFILKYVHF